MTTITFSIIIVLFVIFLFAVFAFINKKERKKELAALLHQLSKSGAENNLSFTSQEVLSGSIIGLDAKNLKLLILQQADDDTYKKEIIDLELVKNCNVKKLYISHHKENSKEFINDNYLDKIILHFEFDDKRPSTVINFYRHINNNIYEMQGLALKAKKWELMLLQMMGSNLKQLT